MIRRPQGSAAAAAPRHHGCPSSRRNRRRSMTCVTSRTCCGRLAIWGGAPIWRPLGLEARVARWLGGPSPPLLADLLPPRVEIDHGRVTCAVIPCPHAGQCQTRRPRPAAVPRLQPSTRTGLAAVHCVPVLMAGASRQPGDAIVRHIGACGPSRSKTTSGRLGPRPEKKGSMAGWCRGGRRSRRGWVRFRPTASCGCSGVSHKRYTIVST